MYNNSTASFYKTRSQTENKCGGNWQVILNTSLDKDGTNMYRKHTSPRLCINCAVADPGILEGAVQDPQKGRSVGIFKLTGKKTMGGGF